MPLSLHNKVTIITGASSGIGQATAITYARHGAKVVLAARRQDRLNQLRDHIHQFNPHCWAIPTDITNPSAITNLFTQTEQEVGPLDILINNAGTGLAADLIDIDYDAWQQLLDTNITSVYLCSQHATKNFIHHRRHGHIITVSSIAGRFGAPGFAAYSASKHGVTGFNKALKWELRRHNIKVSTIHPFRVNTEFFLDYDEQPHHRHLLSSQDIADILLALGRRSTPQLLYYLSRNFGKRITSLIAYLIGR
ncbi:MAG TPA: SDR family oxidoreductase [Anaerolineae bacterium]|nr:SDR family oxidoreductase [Anaerolineae bacterium]